MGKEEIGRKEGRSKIEKKWIRRRNKKKGGKSREMEEEGMAEWRKEKKGRKGSKATRRI